MLSWVQDNVKSKYFSCYRYRIYGQRLSTTLKKKILKHDYSFIHLGRAERAIAPHLERIWR